MTGRGVVALLVGLWASLLGPGLARANSCQPHRSQLHPLVGAPPRKYGRLCPIVLFSAQPPSASSAGFPIRPEEVTITAGGMAIPFDVMPAGDVAGEHAIGCDPASITHYAPAPYSRFILTPREALPASARITASGTDARGQSSASTNFETSERLDRENCETLPSPARSGLCQPPLDRCRPPDAGASDGSPTLMACAMGGGPPARYDPGMPAVLLLLAALCRTRRTRRR